LLRNRSFGPLAVTVLPIALAWSSAASVCAALQPTTAFLRCRCAAGPPAPGPRTGNDGLSESATRAKSRLHYVLFITALIVWNRTRASTSWTLTFVVGVFVDDAFSFTFWTGFHS
jgi:hypothetical protein